MICQNLRLVNDFSTYGNLISSFNYLGQLFFLCLTRKSLRLKSWPHWSQLKVLPSCDNRCRAKLWLSTLWLHSVQILKFELTFRLVSRWSSTFPLSGEALGSSSGTFPTSPPRMKGQFGISLACSFMGSSPSTQSPTMRMQKAHLHESWLLKEKKPALARSAGCMKLTFHWLKEASLAASDLKSGSTLQLDWSEGRGGSIGDGEEVEGPGAHCLIKGQASSVWGDPFLFLEAGEDGVGARLDSLVTWLGSGEEVVARTQLLGGDFTNSIKCEKPMETARSRKLSTTRCDALTALSKNNFTTQVSIWNSSPHVWGEKTHRW